MNKKPKIIWHKLPKSMIPTRKEVLKVFRLAKKRASIPKGTYE